MVSVIVTFTITSNNYFNQFKYPRINRYICKYTGAHVFNIIYIIEVTLFDEVIKYEE